MTPKPKGPSAEEIRLQKERADELARKEAEANAEASRERSQRLAVTAARKKATLGRPSLIGTSELGAKRELK